MNAQKVQPQLFVLEVAGVSILMDHTHAHVKRDIFIYNILLRTSTNVRVSVLLKYPSFCVNTSLRSSELIPTNLCVQLVEIPLLP